jgi:hypothetical protein
MSEEIEDLIQALESIRSEEFENVPAKLVEEIIRIEHETIEERDKTQDMIADAVESSIKELR